jgi:hypothetical protein
MWKSKERLKEEQNGKQLQTSPRIDDEKKKYFIST